MKATLLIVLMKVISMALLPVMLFPMTAAADEELSLAARIYGSQEQASGLFLMPWQSAQASDVDRPPSLLNEPPQRWEAQEFERYIEWHQAHQAYRRWRLQRNNW